MKRMLWIIPAIVVLCVTTHAQAYSEWDIAGGYSYWDANLNGTRFGLSGGGGSLTQNMNSWFAGRLDFDAYGGTQFGRSIGVQTITYGPVLSARRFNKWVPFGTVQVGAIHGSQGYLGISESAYKFDFTGGGGADFNINDRAGIRAEAVMSILRSAAG